MASKSKLMTNYGWVQNTSNLSTVRDTIDLVPEHGVTHRQLMIGIKRYREEKRDLPKRWEWDARCRIKAIHALGLVKLDRHIQGYELTALGKKLKECPESSEKSRNLRLLTEEEKKIFHVGLLTNPPVIRVLDLLNEDKKKGGQGLTKYSVGENLGFVGDIGFTHIDPYWVVNQRYSFNNKEGDADKWARTILSWLIQVGWIKKSGYQDISGKKLQRYEISLNPDMEKIMRYYSTRIPRNVAVEMLCSDHHPFPKLIQKRRMIILRMLNAEPKTSNQIIEELKKEGLEATKEVCEFEILNLKNAGFRIIENGGYFKLNDKIKLDFVDIKDVESSSLQQIEGLIEKEVVKYERTIPPRLVDHLIRFGYDGSKGAEFEGVVAEYFRFLGYDSEYLGQGKGRVTDILVKYVHPTVYARSYGLIVDAKATSDKYCFPAGDKRKMKEYISKHGPILLEHKIPNHAFSFVSSEFVENLKEHLKEIYGATKINGSAMKVVTLLEIGHRVRCNDLKIEDIYSKFTCNDLVTIN